MMRRLTGALLSLLALASLGLAACNTATSVADCAFIVGNGQDSNDANLHHLVWPGQTWQYDSNESVAFVPCNARNYSVGKPQTNANNETIGDRKEPSLANMKDGTPLEVSSTAYFTLDQKPEALKAFYPYCLKFHCASNQADTIEVNSATKGWNSMLGESIGKAVDDLVKSAVTQPGITNDLWKTHDRTQTDQIAKYLSDHFKEAASVRTGYNVDLFCGSGSSSGWKNDKVTGRSDDFDCGKVRFVIDDVELAPLKADNQAASQGAQNDIRRANAEKLYGPQTPYWLGLQDTLQDTVQACADKKVNCTINIGTPQGVNP